jgi:hypothetical protein
LNLPIEETPPAAAEPQLDRWANVDAFGAIGDGVADDTHAVQAALEAGRPIVYFPKVSYRLTRPVRIPAAVRRIMAFYGAINGQLHVAETAVEPLLIEDVGDTARLTVRHLAPRTLVLSHVRGNYLNENVVPGVKVFINNCNGLGKSPQAFRQGRFWIRFMNTEYKQAPNFTCNASDMWVLGYKVEGPMTNFEVINGGRLEVLGGVANEHGGGFSATIPALRNVDSYFSFVGTTSGPLRFEVIAEETFGGQTRRVLRTDCPPRPGSSRYRKWDDVFVPLWVSRPPVGN